ncbi:MAG: hypothetical protein AB7F59_07400 [Bdellovibrionales bacterium]
MIPVSFQKRSSLGWVFIILLPLLGQIFASSYVWSWRLVVFYLGAWVLFGIPGSLFLRRILPDVDWSYRAFAAPAFGLVGFSILVSVYAPLGDHFYASVLLGVWILLTFLVFIYDQKRPLKVTSITSSDWSRIYMVGLLLAVFWFLISKWYNALPHHHADVDSQAYTVFAYLMDKFQSYNQLALKRYSTAVGFIYPPAFFGTVAGILGITKMGAVEATILMVQYTLFLIAVASLLTLDRVFKNHWITVAGSYFVISSGFCTHMWGGGSTDAMGLYSISIGLFFVSTLQLNWKEDCGKLLALGLSLGLAMLSNSIYFFYFGFGLVASTLFLPFLRVPKLSFKSRFLYQVKAGFLVGVVSIATIVPWVIGFANPYGETTTGYETTIENTSPLHGPALLVERLQARGWRLSMDVVIAGVGLLTLIAFGTYTSLVAAGSLFFIFVHLQADWIAKWLWLPGYHVTLKEASAWVQVPYIFRNHEPFYFSWISVDAFMALAAASIAYFVIRLGTRLIGKWGVALPFVCAILFASVVPQRFWVQPFVSYAGAQVFEVPMDLVQFVRENTDPESTFIITPFYMASSVEGQPRMYGWAWLSPMTEREAFEDRTFAFVRFWNGVDEFNKAIKLDPKFQRLLELHKYLYSAKYTTVPEGEFQKIGVTHAVIPRAIFDRVKDRTDIEVMFEYKDSVGGAGLQDKDGGYFIRFK